MVDTYRWSAGRHAGIYIHYIPFIFTLLFSTALFSTTLTAQTPDLDTQRARADSLYTLGSRLWEAGKTTEGGSYLGQSLSIYLTTGVESKNEASYSHAIGDFTRALDIYSRLLGPEDTSVAKIHAEVAYLYWKMKDYPNSLNNYRKALRIRLAVLDHSDPLIASNYINISLIQCEMGNYQQALRNREQALAVQLKAFGSRDTAVASSYANLGYIYYKLGSYQLALDNHEKALEIEEIASMENEKMATRYTDIGYLQYQLGEYDAAIANQNKALDIRKKIHGSNHPDLANNYIIIGGIYKSQGKCSSALQSYQHALNLRKEALGPAHPDLAPNYSNIGTLYLEMASYQLALENLKKALTLRLNSGKKPDSELAANYNNIGSVYLALGDYTNAQANLKTALDIDIAVLGAAHPDVAARYNNLGNVYSKTGNFTQALSYYQKAADIWLAALGPQDPVLATVYNNIGVIYANQDKPSSALPYYEKALTLKLAELDSNHSSLAYSYNNIGNAYEGMSKYEDAFGFYMKALEIWIKTLGEDHPNVGASFSRIGLVYDYLGKPDSAVSYLARSIEIFERSRGEIESTELQAAYSETVKDRYEAIVSILMVMGRPDEAFAYLERSKSRALKTAFTESGCTGIGDGGIGEKLEETKELAREVEALESQLAEEYSKPDSVRNQEVVKNITTSLAATKAEYFKVAAQIQSDPDYSSLVRVNAADIGVLQSELPMGQKLLMTYAADDELYLFLVSREGYEVRSVSVKRSVLDSMVVRCRVLCSDSYVRELHSRDNLFGWDWTNDGSDFYKREVAPLKSILKGFYTYLVEPFEAELSSARVVTFIPSGNLYYVPWGALMSENSGRVTFLSERYNWSVLTSTELFQCIYRRSGDDGWRPDSLLLVGNPTGAGLPSAEREVSSIKQVYPNSIILTGSQATEFEVQRNASHSEVLHLATHCRLNAENPWDSYIHLSKTSGTDGRWTAAEITNQSWNRIRLVTLSACETAVGSSQPGLEFESMAKAFSLAMECAPSIVATLWPVADESTKEFMITFYEELKNSRKSEALRKAQQEMISHDLYSHPFFWASFILIGEWR